MQHLSVISILQVVKRLRERCAIMAKKLLLVPPTIYRHRSFHQMGSWWPYHSLEFFIRILKSVLGNLGSMTTSLLTTEVQGLMRSAQHPKPTINSKQLEQSSRPQLLMLRDQLRHCIRWVFSSRIPQKLKNTVLISWIFMTLTLNVISTNVGCLSSQTSLARCLWLGTLKTCG